MDPLYLDEDDDAPARPWLRPLLVGLVALASLVVLTFALRAFLAHPVERGPGIRQIALVQPPPTPPKPPEKPPEPPKVKEEVKVDEPKPEPKADDPKPADKPAADKPLGLDANGSAGSDQFGMNANKGGQDIAGSGSGGGGSGAYYSGLLQRAFFDALSRNRDVLHEQFRVVVKIWLSDDGHVTRADIVSGSGNGDVDKQIQAALMDIQPLRDIPPSTLRQIELRLSNRS